MKQFGYKAYKAKQLLFRFTVCAMFGHFSTGTFLWWMCDRCHTDFAASALPSEYIDEVKVTRSTHTVATC